MEEMELGPNGGLVYAFEYINENQEWLHEQLGDGDDEYYIFDCPGQIELYSHVPVMRSLVQSLQRWGFMVCGVYVLDSQFLADSSKFMSGCLACLAAMVQLEIPHVNVISKLDLVRKKKSFMEKFFHPDMSELVSELNEESNPSLYRLNDAMGGLLVRVLGVTAVCMRLAEPARAQALQSLPSGKRGCGCGGRPSLPCPAAPHACLLPAACYNPLSSLLADWARGVRAGGLFHGGVLAAQHLRPGINTVCAFTHRQCYPIWRGSGAQGPWRRSGRAR